MNAEHFNLFAKAFKQYNYNRINRPNKDNVFIKDFDAYGGYTDNGKPIIEDLYGIENFDDKGENFAMHVEDALTKTKIFEIEDNVKKLLCMTKTPTKNDDLHLPFPVIFLDVKFTKEELAEYGVHITWADELVGLLVTEETIVFLQDENGKISDKPIGEFRGQGLRLTMCSIKEAKTNNEDKEVWFDTFNKNVNLDNEFMTYEVREVKTSDKVAREFWYRFFLNFLNFVNLPEVTYIEHKRSDANIQRKIKKGIPIIPSTINIILTGRIKKYVDNINEKTETQWHYNYQFDVKGHYRFLTSDRYKQKGVIWVEPFRKGSGIYVPSTYKLHVKQEKQIQIQEQEVIAK